MNGTERPAGWTVGASRGWRGVEERGTAGEGISFGLHLASAGQV